MDGESYTHTCNDAAVYLPVRVHVLEILSNGDIFSETKTNMTAYNITIIGVRAALLESTDVPQLSST